MWNWQWDCPGGAPAPAGAPSVCVQCNIALSIRIASPGDDGDVTQSNFAASTTVAQNAASAAAVAALQPTAPHFVQPAPVAFSMPPIPPPPTVDPPPLGVVPTVDVQRVLAGVSPRLPSPAATLAHDGPWLGGAEPNWVTQQRSMPRRHPAVRSRTVVRVESHAFTRVVVVEKSRVSSVRPHKKAAAHAPGTAAPQIPSPLRMPFAPSSPAASGSSGSSGHGGGASLLTASLIGALTLLAFALLSSVVTFALPGRRRLSDDRRARPG